MTEPQPPAPGANRAGYQRSFPGLVGAMLVVVVVVLGWSLFRAVTSDKEPVPVRTVDWEPVVAAAAEQGRFPVLAPPRLPEGWRATSATWSPSTGHLHVGLLTDAGRYVGLEQSSSTSMADLVDQYVDEDADRGEEVTVAGTGWQSWTDHGGDYAVARSAPGKGGGRTHYLVVGSAEPEEIRDFAASLEPVDRR